LFYIHKRLQEAKPGRDDEPFGGMLIVVLGDWKQLPPVLVSPLYQDPSELQGRTDAVQKKDQEKNAITEFGIKRQKCKSGISYNAFSTNPESPIMKTAIKESPIMSYLAKAESPIMETAIKE
jgi:hypothetical protein